MPMFYAQMTRFIHRFSRFYSRQFTPLLEETGLAMREIHVLLFLANHPGADTARDVSDLRGLSKSQVSQAVETLAARGLLRRMPDRGDRRVVHLTITENGLPLARRAQAIQAACGAWLLEDLTEEERAQFLRILEGLLRKAEELTEGGTLR